MHIIIIIFSSTRSMATTSTTHAQDGRFMMVNTTVGRLHTIRHRLNSLVTTNSRVKNKLFLIEKVPASQYLKTPLSVHTPPLLAHNGSYTMNHVLLSGTYINPSTTLKVTILYSLSSFIAKSEAYCK